MSNTACAADTKSTSDMSEDAKQYVRYWAALTGRSESDIYIPEALR